MNPAYILSLNPVVVVEVLALMIIMVLLFLFFGALAASAEATWTKVFLAAVVGISAQWVIAVVLSVIPVVGGLLGFIFGIFAMIYILKYTFMTDWRQAAMIFALAALAEIVTGAVLELYTGIGFLTFAQKLFFVS